MSSSEKSSPIVVIPSRYFVGGCAALALAVLALSSVVAFPSWLIAVEVLATVLGLFVFGSTRVRIDKNSLSYGSVLVTAATFWAVWWPTSFVRGQVAVEGGGAIARTVARYTLSLHGWDELIHADTMLFILGLTFFVAAIAETRLLERIGFFILRKNQGRVVPTVIVLAGVVSVASGILDGVSMIGLMIRVLIVVLVLAKAKEPAMIYAVLVSTITTTVCGMWLAYGEPPNLIMKSNLQPHLTDLFFLKFCLPVAVGSYAIVVWNIRRVLSGLTVDVASIVKESAAVDTPALRRAQRAGLVSFLPFIGLLVWHAMDHSVPLFWSSFVGCGAAFWAIRSLPQASARALKEGKHEYAEYLFLLPLFLSVTFLQKTGFFDDIARLLSDGTDRFGAAHMAYAQFVGATALSGVLDNNVVADFAGRAIHGFELGVLHLFAMAQIAGYAVGGCWTHIGSAQSVVAYSFLRKNVAPSFTPFQWIKAITPALLEIVALVTVLVYLAAWLTS